MFWLYKCQSYEWELSKWIWRLCVRMTYVCMYAAATIGGNHSNCLLPLLPNVYSVMRRICARTALDAKYILLVRAFICIWKKPLQLCVRVVEKFHAEHEPNIMKHTFLVNRGFLCTVTPRIYCFYLFCCCYCCCRFSLCFFFFAYQQENKIVWRKNTSKISWLCQYLQRPTCANGAQRLIKCRAHVCHSLFVYFLNAAESCDGLHSIVCRQCRRKCRSTHCNDEIFINYTVCIELYQYNSVMNIKKKNIVHSFVVGGWFETNGKCMTCKALVSTDIVWRMFVRFCKFASVSSPIEA